MRLLLLSNSTPFGGALLDHAIEPVRVLFANIGRIAFVPFALHDRRGYTARVADRFAREGIEVVEVTADANGGSTIRDAGAVFVGGGNTFRLLDALERAGLLQPLRERALGGMPYLGASAGTNIAAPTIMTTNDMPIVEPRSFAALGLVPFQINPHYIDGEPSSRHMGETRETRLLEYLEENDRLVVGLREGAWLAVDGENVVVGGANGARIFERGLAPREVVTGQAL